MDVSIYIDQIAARLHGNRQSNLWTIETAARLQTALLKWGMLNAMGYKVSPCTRLFLAVKTCKNTFNFRAKLLSVRVLQKF